MPLHLIHGPPNSGRTDKVQQAYLEVLPRRPVLVVPSVADIFDWERRLTRETSSLVGGQIVHFRDLHSEVLKLGTAKVLDEPSALTRRRLTKDAINSEGRASLRRLVERPGTVDSVLDLIDDFRNNLLDPDTFDHHVQDEDREYLAGLGKVFRKYLEAMSSASLRDGPGRAIDSLDVAARHWKERPVFIAGFDDMTKLQMDLVARLAANVKVTVAITNETGSAAMELTDSLIADLRDLVPSGQLTEESTSRPEKSGTHDPVLFEIEKRFMSANQHEPELLEPDHALTIMRSVGRRNEAEAVAGEIAGLLARGVEPDQIAIAINDPAGGGRLFRNVLAGFDIAVSLESETPVAETVVGMNLLSLLDAFQAPGRDHAGGIEGSPFQRLFTWLRGPAGPDPELVDEIEKRCLDDGVDDCERIVGMFAERGSPVPGWAELESCGAELVPLAETIGSLARSTALGTLDHDRGKTPGPDSMLETQAGAAIARLCSDIAEESSPEDGLEQIREAILSGAASVWSVPANGTVRIASPYSLRAKRFRHLFMVSLQEGGTQDTERAGPFLSVDDRAALRMSRRSDPEVQERYLFYSCLTVPTEGLWLSCRTADETGKAERPSPLIGSVEELFASPPRAGGRPGSQITFPPGRAPSEDELARSLASLSHRTAEVALDKLDLDATLSDALGSRLAEADTAEARTRRLANLTLRPIIDELTRDATFSATDIEAYAGCPYRWFIERQLNPQGMGPDAEPMVMGSLIHAALDKLYTDRPGSLPRSHDLDDWLDAVPDTVETIARSSRIRLDRDLPGHRVARARATQLIQSYLEREAERPEPVPFHPAELEVGIGSRNADHAAVSFGNWSLKGKVDRVDLTPAQDTSVRRDAVIIDYKSGGIGDLTLEQATWKRRIQIQLYMHAAKEVLGVNPVAGLYMPIRANDTRPRGIGELDEAGRLGGYGVFENDLTEEMDIRMSEALAIADEAATGLMNGLLDHDPATCPNHFDHPAVPDRVDEGDDGDAGQGSRS